MYKDTKTRPGKKAPKNIFPALTESTLNALGIFIEPLVFLKSIILKLSAASDAVAN